MADLFHIWLYSIASVVFVSLLSLIGVITLSVKTKNLTRILIYIVSFSAGALFGDAFIHLLPEAVTESGMTLYVSLSVLSGIGVMFIIEKIIQWNHCHLPITRHHVHSFTLMTLVGDGVHNFIDGLIIGASYLASVPIGVSTSIAIVLHEIPQEFSHFGILIHGGFTKGRALFVNFLSALTAVVGTIVALLAGQRIAGTISFLIPFAAGGFIYIAGSDLIPELHRECETNKSIIQFLCFAAGIGVMVLLLKLG